MKTKTIKRVVVSMLLVSILTVVSTFLVGALVDGENSGTRTHGSGAYINWAFYSEGSGNTMSNCRFTRLAGSTGVSVTDQHRILHSREAYGYVKATVYGSLWLPTDTILTWHTISNNVISVHVG